MRELLVKTLGGTMRAIEEIDPSYPAPKAARRDVRADRAGSGRVRGEGPPTALAPPKCRVGSAS